ncbi:HlyU family transcriptional regulator [Tolumonas lignilytica]|jgi:Uncharacterized conserved protein|uniref:HlyU family transcriptional regulator n=1 Tax=Tolumonas lignilytica TaxID=1283284 RepID=UPI000464240C|nr:HlyU family transcriptional regulator [Tolumonas lignilytica]
MFSKLVKSLFGGAEKPAMKVEPVEYKGYLIYAEPKDEGSQYRLAGRICKEINGELKTHLFIRSDLFPSKEDASQWMVRKAELFIDQTGDHMFQ